MNTETKLTCDCCNKNEAIGVFASTMGAVSLAYCKDCLSKGIEPYDMMVSYISCGCNSFDDMNSTYKKIVKANLDFYDKTIEEFNNDIEEINKEYEKYYNY